MATKKTNTASPKPKAKPRAKLKPKRKKTRKQASRPKAKKQAAQQQSTALTVIYPEAVDQVPSIFARLNEVQKHAGGRPRRYKTPEAMQKELDLYIYRCLHRKRDRIIRGGRDTGDTVVSMDCPEMPTIGGAALALGFLNRKALDHYGKTYPEFSPTITYMRETFKEMIEKLMFDPDATPSQVRACTFWLSCRGDYVPAQAVKEEDEDDQQEQEYGIIILPEKVKPPIAVVADAESKEA